MEGDESIRSVNRALQILKWLGSKPEMSLSELTRIVNLPKTTTLRLLKTLLDEEFIEKTERGGYQLGLSIMQLGLTVEKRTDLISVGTQVMKNMAKEANETIAINIISKYKRLCIAKIESTHPIREFIEIGDMLPLYRGASSKILLAFMEPGEQEKVFSQIGDEKINIDALKQELAKIRNQGYVSSAGERIQGASAVSAPIFGKDRRLLGGLSISGPTDRFAESAIKSYICMVTENARRISLSLGYLP